MGSFHAPVKLLISGKPEISGPRAEMTASNDSNHGNAALELLEQAAESLDPILDSAGTKRVPVGCGVDGDDRLAEPKLRGGGQTNHAEVGTDLDDRVDIVAIKLAQHLTAGLRADLGDLDPARALQAAITNDLEAAFTEIPTHLRVRRRK